MSTENAKSTDIYGLEIDQAVPEGCIQVHDFQILLFGYFKENDPNRKTENLLMRASKTTRAIKKLFSASKRSSDFVRTNRIDMGKQSFLVNYFTPSAVEEILLAKGIRDLCGRLGLADRETKTGINHETYKQIKQVATIIKQTP